MVILGVIILGGIVVNNGIVLIDYANILRNQGLSAYEAIILASRRRLRPIAMTALTTILGLVPLALALNEGAQLQQPMAIAVIGGLTISTFLSLVVIPTLYLGLEEALVFVRKNILGVTPPPAPKLKPPKPPAPPSTPKPEPTKPTPLPPLSKPEQLSTPPSAPPKPEPPPLKPALPKPEPPSPKPETPTPPKLEPPKQEPPTPSKPAPTLPPKETSDRGSIPLELWGFLSSRQRELIVYIRKNKKVSRKDYAERFDISIPTAARDLKILLDKGILTAEGPSGQGRYYVLSKNV